MFDRIKKLFHATPEARTSEGDSSLISEWAGTQGFSFTGHSGSSGFSIDGKVRGHRWRLERGRSSRDFIAGEELRAKAELGVSSNVAVVLMNRHLKEALDKRAYHLYTDSVQTTVDPNLPEEMRWLAVYEEFAWSGLSGDFWSRYAVIADRKEHAQSWVTPDLAGLLLDWPEPAPDLQVPFLLMLMRGKTYLRMEYRPAEFNTIQHAASIFHSACEGALSAFPLP